MNDTSINTGVILHCNGYYSVVYFDTTDESFYESAEGIDSIRYRSRSILDAMEDFWSAVDDYLIACNEYNYEIKRNYLINVPPSIWTAAKRESLSNKSTSELLESILGE